MVFQVVGILMYKENRCMVSDLWNVCNVIRSRDIFWCVCVRRERGGKLRIEREQSFKALKNGIFISIAGMPNKTRTQFFQFFTDSSVPVYGKWISFDNQFLERCRCRCWFFIVIVYCVCIEPWTWTGELPLNSIVELLWHCCYLGWVYLFARS